MIKEIESLKEFIRNGYSLANRTIKQIDFTKVEVNWQTMQVKHATFLGCKFVLRDKIYLIEQGAMLIESPTDIPYQPFRNSLYTWQELMQQGQGTRDLEIYEHFSTHKYNTNLNEALWQRIHDHSIDDALREYIGMTDEGVPMRKCIGVMGGHGTLRTDPFYHKVARLSKLLTEMDYMVVSGGGPGIMEAANLGAYLAFKSEGSLEDALAHLGEAPHYTDREFTAKAIEFCSYTSSNVQSLAIPTWFYGHEPSNVFASAIAKYFSNSIREDTLLAICLHGVIFAPGSAGTAQEIFMDAAQNHYGTYGYISPMVFLGRDHYEYDTMLFPLLKRLARHQEYYRYLYLSDDVQEVLEFIATNPPRKLWEK